LLPNPLKLCCFQNFIQAVMLSTKLSIIMEGSENKHFTVNLQADGPGDKTIEVNVKETTDGLPYYVFDGGQGEVQLRKDDTWEVIWGELDAESAEQIGAEIDKHTAKKSE
jgi:hypothetical protein